MPLIQLDEVSKVFGFGDATTLALDEVNLSVEKGEFVAIVGPSGCGKTTLMNIIGGFLAADSGGVHVDGALREGPNRKGVLITQQGSVFPWLTVRQNLLFGLDEQNP